MDSGSQRRPASGLGAQAKARAALRATILPGDPRQTSSFRLPWPRIYDVQVEGHGDDYAGRLRRGQAVRRLERAIGVGDAWAFIAQADKDRNAAARDAWAVEYDGAVERPRR